MERIRLTNQRIEQAKAAGKKSNTGKPIDQFFMWDTESPGLAARITLAGAKTFIFQGKLNKAAIRMTIGPCKSWTLEDARTEARRLKILIDKGIDPREVEKEKHVEKEKKKTEVEAAKKYTLKALLETYTDHLDAQGKSKSAAHARSIVNVHLLKSDPALAERPATSITSHDIAALIRQVREKGKQRAPGILRSILSAAYNCGRRAPFDTELSSTFIKFNIVNNPVNVIPTIPINAGNRTLSKDELKKYMAALADTEVDMAMKLALFSGGQRMAELLRAEIADWNEETETLRLLDPKGKRRTPREHFLPLGPVASSIVNELVKQAKQKETTLIFPSIQDYTIGPRASEISRIIKSEPFDMRDIRRTCETMLASLGVSRDIRAQLLSHGISGVQAQHYDRHDYLNEKRATLIKWERYLAQIANDDNNNVIPFKAEGQKS